MKTKRRDEEEDDVFQGTRRRYAAKTTQISEPCLHLHHHHHHNHQSPSSVLYSVRRSAFGVRRQRPPFAFRRSKERSFVRLHRHRRNSTFRRRRRRRYRGRYRGRYRRRYRRKIQKKKIKHKKTLRLCHPSTDIALQKDAFSSCYLLPPPAASIPSIPPMPPMPPMPSMPSIIRLIIRLTVGRGRVFVAHLLQLHLGRRGVA